MVAPGEQMTQRRRLGGRGVEPGVARLQRAERLASRRQQPRQGPRSRGAVAEVEAGPLCLRDEVSCEAASVAAAVGGEGSATRGAPKRASSMAILGRVNAAIFGVCSDALSTPPRPFQRGLGSGCIASLEGCWEDAPDVSAATGRTRRRVHWPEEECEVADVSDVECDELVDEVTCLPSPSQKLTSCDCCGAFRPRLGKAPVGADRWRVRFLCKEEEEIGGALCRIPRFFCDTCPSRLSLACAASTSDSPQALQDFSCQPAKLSVAISVVTMARFRKRLLSR